MHIASVDGEDFFSIAAFKGNVTVAWMLGSGHGRARRMRKEHADGDWTSLRLQIKDGSLEAHFIQDDWSEEALAQNTHQFTEADFPIDAWYQLVTSGRVILGAGPPISIASSSSISTFTSG